jgi:hypothetical protein
MVNFMLGMQTAALLYILYLCLLGKYKAALTEMYKAGYAKSQTDDTTQLLAAVRAVPYEYGNLIWKHLTKTDLPEEKVEADKGADKVITGFSLK